MPSSARRIMFPISGTFRRNRNRVLRADEGIGPYIGRVTGRCKFHFPMSPGAMPNQGFF